jgi:hypothetical protein
MVAPQREIGISDRAVLVKTASPEATPLLLVRGVGVPGCGARWEESGSTWSARSEARTNDVDAGDERRTLGSGTLSDRGCR